MSMLSLFGLDLVDVSFLALNFFFKIFFRDLLEDHANNQEEMLSRDLYAVFGFLLQKLASASTSANPTGNSSPSISNNKNFINAPYVDELTVAALDRFIVCLSGA